MAKTAAYGTWTSPITGESLVAEVVALSSIATDAKDTYWIERRPGEAGRQVIVVMRGDGSIEDLLPPPYSARTTVHEYGGRCYCVRDGRVYFTNLSDQRIYTCDG